MGQGSTLPKIAPGTLLVFRVQITFYVACLRRQGLNKVQVVLKENLLYLGQWTLHPILEGITQWNWISNPKHLAYKMLLYYDVGNGK